MKIAGIPMNDIWAHRVLRERGVETTHTENGSADIVVLVESIALGHHDAGQNYRPYLHLNGELRSVRPHQRLPYGVDEVTFPVGGGEAVDVFYEFDDDQLAQLTQKGYFSPGFSLPEQVTGIEWELPATVDALVLAPAGIPYTSTADAPDVPVVFVRVHNLGSLDVDLESSGYDLTEYFAERGTEAGQLSGPRFADEAGMRARSDAITPLFDESDLEPAQADRAGRVPATESEAAKGAVAAQMEAVATALNAEEEQLRLQREAQAGTSENIYRSRVAGALEDTPTAADAAKHLAPVKEPDVLDLDGDEADELGIAPVHTEPLADTARLNELKHKVTLRAADLDLRDSEHAAEQQL
ncbi:hypothetical protein ACI2LF_24515 [Kribbella sp. NPDC020789]